MSHISIAQNLQQLATLRDRAAAVTGNDSSTLTGQVNALIAGYGQGETADWVRPADWPDLAAVDMRDFEGVYATYEVLANAHNFLSLYGGDLSVEEVEIAADGTVNVVQTMETTLSGSITRADLDSLEAGYHCFRITGFTAGFYFQSSHSIQGGTLPARNQRCLEYVLRLPEITCTVSGGQYIGTFSTEQVHWQDTTLKFNCSAIGGFGYSASLAQCSFTDCSVGGTGFYSLFYECRRLTSLDLRGWDTGSVTTMQYMFSYSGLVSLDLSGWNVEACSNFAQMFQRCASLTSLNLSGWNPCSATNLSQTFQNCTALTQLELGGWDVRQVLTLSYTFGGCMNLQSLDLSGWDLQSCTTGGTEALNQCYGLSALTLGKIYCSLTLSASALYSAETLVAILEALAEVSSTQTLTLGSTNKAKLTEAQLAIAAEKGWTVA